MSICEGIFLLVEYYTDSGSTLDLDAFAFDMCMLPGLYFPFFRGVYFAKNKHHQCSLRNVFMYLHKGGI